jgi:hypothetical protein
MGVLAFYAWRGHAMRQGRRFGTDAAERQRGRRVRADALEDEELELAPAPEPDELEMERVEDD